MDGNYIGNNPNGLDLVLSDDASTNRSDLIASTKCVFNAMQESVIGSGILPGTIVAFSGQFGGEGNRYPIPLTGTEPDTHWCLCDGIETNNLTVPDLRGKMILGSSTEHTVGETGGSETHTHSLTGTVGETTLSVEQIAGHAHASYGSRYGQNASRPGSKFASDSGDRSNGGTQYTKTAGGSLPHTHDLTGASGDASSLPPYYVLSFIMRCA